MKDQSQAAIQFSGYPLAIVDPQKKTGARLAALKPPLSPHTTFIQKNKITNDPMNWDVNWFNGYE